MKSIESQTCYKNGNLRSRIILNYDLTVLKSETYHPDGSLWSMTDLKCTEDSFWICRGDPVKNIQAIHNDKQMIRRENIIIIKINSFDSIEYVIEKDYVDIRYFHGNDLVKIITESVDCFLRKDFSYGLAVGKLYQWYDNCLECFEVTTGRNLNRYYQVRNGLISCYVKFRKDNRRTGDIKIDLPESLNCRVGSPHEYFSSYNNELVIVDSKRKMVITKFNSGFINEIKMYTLEGELYYQVKMNEIEDDHLEFFFEPVIKIAIESQVRFGKIIYEARSGKGRKMFNIIKPYLVTGKL